MTLTALNPEVQPSNLNNCDREPIHQLGAVQSIGFLMVISADWCIVRASENIVGFLGRPWGDLLGVLLGDVINAEAVHAIRNLVASLRAPDSVGRAFGVQLQDDGPLFDVAVHLVNDKVVVECEPSEPESQINTGSLVRLMVERLQTSHSLIDFMREAVRQVRSLTRLDRVMLYRFLPDGSGEVVAESLRSGVDSFLGLRYPATDIPVQARALFVRNGLRLIANVSAEPAAVRPCLDSAGEALDLSMSVLRSVSPIHIEYLKNMGVQASVSISILRKGKLWGLFACHGMEPTRIGFERRTAAELFTQVFSLMLDGRLRDEELAYEANTRHLHNQLVAAMAADGAPEDTVANLDKTMADLVPSDGIGFWVNGKAVLKGMTPTREEFAGLLRFINRTAASQVYSTCEIAKSYAPALDFSERAAGLLAIPISRTCRDYLIFFRREVASTVTWSGNPNKLAEPGPNGDRLAPRKSFEAWREVVRGQSLPWTEAELSAAGSLRTTLLEVFLRLSDVAEQERQRATEKQDLLIAELNHRVRNILNLVSGLVSQSKAGATDVESFAAVLGGRVQALARAHDQITADSWGPVALAALVATESAAYHDTQAERVQARGAVVLLKPQAFSTVALVIHELMTNSAKYGALSVAHGKVDIEWAVDKSSGHLSLDWREIGGPPVQAPTRRGFGSAIIERAIPFELKGQATVKYLLSGLQAHFAISSEYFIVGAKEPLELKAPDQIKPQIQLHGKVLLVEDSMIIALNAEEILLSLGAQHVDTASSTREAFSILDLYTPTFAMLDIHLGNETSFLIAERLQTLGVPYIFASGYGDNIAFPAGQTEVAIVKKPYTAESIAYAASPVLTRR